MNTGTLSNHARVSSAQFVKFISRSAASPGAQARDTGTATSGTLVSLSGKGWAASTNDAIRGAPDFAQHLSRALHENPDAARAVVESFARKPDAAIVAVPANSRDSAGMTYAANGQAVTARSSAAFEKMASEVQQHRLDIYDTEMARGTAIADIYDKTVAYMDSLPKAYLDTVNWK